MIAAKIFGPKLAVRCTICWAALIFANKSSESSILIFIFMLLSMLILIFAWVININCKSVAYKKNRTQVPVAKNCSPWLLKPSLSFFTFTFFISRVQLILSVLLLCQCLIRSRARKYLPINVWEKVLASNCSKRPVGIIMQLQENYGTGMARYCWISL